MFCTLLVAYLNLTLVAYYSTYLQLLTAVNVSIIHCVIFSKCTGCVIRFYSSLFRDLLSIVRGEYVSPSSVTSILVCFSSCLRHSYFSLAILPFFLNPFLPSITSIMPPPLLPPFPPCDSIFTSFLLSFFLFFLHFFSSYFRPSSCFPSFSPYYFLPFHLPFFPSLS